MNGRVQAQVTLPGGETARLRILNAQPGYLDLTPSPAASRGDMPAAEAPDRHLPPPGARANLASARETAYRWTSPAR